MATELIWQHLDAPGWEHVRVITDHPGWTVYDSILVREHHGQVLRGGYTLVTDKSWRTLELRLMLESAPGSMEGIHLLTEGDGRWTDANDQPIPELDGILDVDIQWTPLTSSLPVNRLQLVQGEESTTPVAYISMPDLVIQPMTQKLTRVDDTRIKRQPGGGAGAQELSVDADGLVTEAQGQFTRTWPR